ncbi:hypothetical protein P0W64_11830 [Tsukamurella sp. 8F]|uniref:Rv2732c family membrane protein n=1 Tax=unclassified Tsukamurella TaxID=2633480 RepID=UPI0023B9222D|nr:MULTISPECIES: hypothetical protein [unclassified Tsukamurella]MDF0531475.1 hypothetical protein [Tsukamurella sp. 8J]MDF0587462.1 hypothetical protein [Tsukamurella sp. 8F]
MSESELDRLRAEVDASEKRVAGEIEAGPTLIVAAVGVLVVIGALLLPHTRGATGIAILTSAPHTDAASIVVVSRVFLWLSVLFGVVASGAAILTRRWVFALIAAAGCSVGCFFGLLSVWSRHTPGLHGEPPSGVGVGLLLGWLALAVLAVAWIRVVWSRTSLMASVEAQRREAVQEWEEITRTRYTGEITPRNIHPQTARPEPDEE